MLHLGLLLTTALTEDPTTKGPSSVARRSRDPGPGRKVSGGHHGHGRRLWQGTRPCHGSRRKQQRRTNGDSEVHDHEESSRGSPKTFWGRDTGWSAKPRGEFESEEEYWDRLSEEYCEMVEGSDEVVWMVWCLDQDSRRKERGTIFCGDTQSVSSAHPQPGTFCVSSSHLPCESERPARTGCASSAFLVSSTRPRSRISCAGSTHCVASAPSQPSVSCASAPHLPG